MQQPLSTGTTQMIGGISASGWKENGFEIQGTNIGLSVNEPTWTDEELQRFQTAIKTRIDIVTTTGRKYFTTGIDGSIITNAAGILSNTRWNHFRTEC